MQLGGSPSMLDEFPDKPKGMHALPVTRLRLAQFPPPRGLPNLNF